MMLKVVFSITCSQRVAERPGSEPKAQGAQIMEIDEIHESLQGPTKQLGGSAVNVSMFINVAT
jgi:hypothetical protein